MILDVDDHAEQIDLLKSWFVDRHLILARVDAREYVDPCIVRGCCRDRSAVHTLELHFGSRHKGTCFVCNEARYRCSLRLAHRCAGKPQGSEHERTGKLKEMCHSHRRGTPYFVYARE